MLKTAECVTPKHPDKMCDIISDSILDEYLKQDPNSRVAVETMGGHGKVVIIGEVTSQGNISYQEIRRIVEDVTGDKNLEVEVRIVKQSQEIAQGVDTGGAGDQGIMVGYACNENEEMIPQELYLARKLCKYIYDIYSTDGKTQITIDDKSQIRTIVASFQSVPEKELLYLVLSWLEEIGIYKSDGINVYTNPAGDWSQGGFEADTGLTGRKLAVDNYGPRIPIGGGAFSGKDSTKVDRSGAYMARKIAVDILKIYPASDVLVKIAYSIGLENPVMVTATIDNGKEEIDLSQAGYDLTPKGIIEELELRSPKFSDTAKWGHFGQNNLWDLKSKTNLNLIY